MDSELWLQPQTLAFTQVYIKSSNFCTSVQYWIQGKYHHKEAIPLLSNYCCLWSSTCSYLVCFKACNQNIQSIGTLNRKLIHTWLIVESLFFFKSTKNFHYLICLLIQKYLLNAVDLGQFEGTVRMLITSARFCNNFHHLSTRNDKVMTF